GRRDVLARWSARISAVEQARFAVGLAQGKLDASARSQSIVRNILHVEGNGTYAIFAKTGWADEIGWWTGWVERNGKVFAFSLNMALLKNSDAPKRIEIGKALLTRLGIV